MIRVKTILYPTDFSSYSNSAYFHALGLAEAYNAGLTILYVYTPGEVPPGSAAADKQHWRSQLEQIRPANKKIPVKHVFLEGDAAVEIVRYADEVAVVPANAVDGAHESVLEVRAGTLLVHAFAIRQREMRPRGIDIAEVAVQRANVDEVLRVLDALQTDKLCPCNWKKGDAPLN